MNYPNDIAGLEKELALVLDMVARDEAALASSERPEVARVFLASSRKLRANLQERLRVARDKETRLDWTDVDSPRPPGPNAGRRA